MLCQIFGSFCNDQSCNSQIRLDRYVLIKNILRYRPLVVTWYCARSDWSNDGVITRGCFTHYWPLWEDSISYRWIPLIKGESCRWSFDMIFSLLLVWTSCWTNCGFLLLIKTLCHYSNVTATRRATIADTTSSFILSNAFWSANTYRQVSNTRRTLVDNWIIDHSDVVGASPVGATPTISSFFT